MVLRLANQFFFGKQDENIRTPIDGMRMQPIYYLLTIYHLFQWPASR